MIIWESTSNSLTLGSLAWSWSSQHKNHLRSFHLNSWFSIIQIKIKDNKAVSYDNPNTILICFRNFIHPYHFEWDQWTIGKPIRDKCIVIISIVRIHTIHGGGHMILNLFRLHLWVLSLKRIKLLNLLFSYLLFIKRQSRSHP